MAEISHVVVSLKANCNLQPCTDRNSVHETAFQDTIFFPLFDELSDDTVENFVIGDSSSDDGSYR